MADTSKVRDRVSGASNEVATRDAPQRSLLTLIEQMKPQMARVLPQHMNPDRMARVATTLVRQTPGLLQSTPESFLGALMTCAQLGLEPGPLGHAYLLPFRNSRQGTTETQLIIGYRGLIDLARRSGHIESLVAREVYAADEFEVEFGLHEKLIHKPMLDSAERGDVIAYYAVAKYVGGGHTFFVMTKPDVEKIRARSRARDNGPWKTDYDEMAKKTVVRRLAKFLPMSVEFAQAVAQDESVRVVQTADDLELPIVTPLEDADPEAVDAEVVDTKTGEIDNDVDPDNDQTIE